MGLTPVRRPAATLWLARPSRFAGISRPAARALLAAFAVLLLLCLTALVTPDPTGPAKLPGGVSDLDLYAGIVESLRHGGSYYAVAADALRLADVPLRPFTALRLPTLAVAQSTVPAMILSGLLYALALGVGVAWYERLTEALRSRVAVGAAMLLLAGGCIACAKVELVPVHELWAGLLIALSLGRYRPGGWLESVGWGLAAMLIRETAALYPLVMAAFAWREGARREAVAWGAALAVLGVVLLAHAYAVAQVVTLADTVVSGWATLPGPGFTVRGWQAATALDLLPLLLAAAVVALALAGWTGWADPRGARVAATLGAVTTLLAITGRTDALYAGLLGAPLLLVGLIFVPDAARDLLGAALDRRRITVRRVSS